MRPSFPLSKLGLDTDWVAAPAPQGPTGDLAQTLPFTNTGVGLRPYAPVHLRGRRDPVTGDWNVTWIRRTRVGGDSWAYELPLGEEVERYAVEVLARSG